MKIAIVGGGIAGLCTALCLKQRGFEPIVVEKAKAFSDVGAGLQLGPNAVKVLSALGLGEVLLNVSDRPQTLMLKSGYSGQTMLSVPFGSAAEERWGAPYLHIHRADLVAVLAEALKAQGIACKLDCEVVAVESQGSGVSLICASKERINADIVVAADGVRSRLRDIWFNKSAPEYTGSVAWRAVVDVQALGRFKLEKVATVWTGRGRHAVTYLLRGGSLANLVAVIDDKDPTDQSWQQLGSADEAITDFKGFDPAVLKILRKAPTLYKWGLYQQKLPKQWHRDRAVLIGDACHAMPPFLAQGAAMAIEDAWVLADTLDKHGADGLDAYQARREDRVAKVMAQSNANGARFHMSSDVARIGAFAALGAGDRLSDTQKLAQFDWLYGVDVTQP